MCECPGCYKGFGCVECGLCMKGEEPADGPSPEMFGKGVIMCKHIWVANSGRGGEPDFRLNRQMSNEPLMHVKCSICGDRTWLTEAQWLAR